MTIKTFQAKLICDPPEQRTYLELTHRLFNTYLVPVLRILYAARRGDYGPEYRQILGTITSAQSAKEQVEAITSLSAKPGSGGKGDWKQIARSLLERNLLLFDRKVELPGFGKEFRRKIFETSFQIILGYETKLKQWGEEHEAWLEKKAEWEAENPEYLSVRPIIQEFERAEGRVSKRRGRWHRWLDFLSSHAELTAWRGEQASINPLTSEERAEARKNSRKAVATALRMFWQKNPELEALDGKHGYYERTFVRSWAKRRNPDGFKHRPTFTLPSEQKHPAWFQFKKNETYKRLDVQAETIDLKVIKSDDRNEPDQRGFTTYRFIADERLKQFHPAETPVKVGTEKCDLIYAGNEILGPRPAAVKGAKLVFRAGQPYLYFSCFIEDAPSRIALKQKAFNNYSPAWVSRQVIADLGGPPRTMALDLGIRHLAVATIMEGDQLIATRFIHNRPRSLITGTVIDGIPTLAQIAAVKRELRRRLRRRGKPVEGQEACIELRRHLRRMSEDRFKKCAMAIVDVARHHKVDILILENLQGLVPDAERERGLNRALVNWNRGQLVQFLKVQSEEWGLRLIVVPAYFTSQICSRCNAIGQRYSFGKGELVFGSTEKIFGCPACSYQCNADFNASRNLHRVFLGTFPPVKKVAKGRYSVDGQSFDAEAVRRNLEQYIQSPF